MISSGYRYWLLISERQLQRTSGLITTGGQRAAENLFGDLFNFREGGTNAPVRLLRPAEVIWHEGNDTLSVKTPGALSLPI